MTYRCEKENHRPGNNRHFLYVLYDGNGTVEVIKDTLDEMGRYLGIGESATYRAMAEHRKHFGKPKKFRELVRIPMEDAL